MPSPTWFPATPPGTDFSDCRNHCEHLFREILRNYPSCTHSDEHQCYYENCVQLLNGKVEAARKDIEEECPQICSTMGHAMPDIDVAKDMSRMEIRRFCLESLERTTNSPTTITYPNEEFSDCKELCENVFPITLKPRKFFCEDKGKPFNPCVLSSCKKSISRVSMDNGQDGKDACPKMCSTMAVAMRGRDMNRRLFSRKKIEEFCSKIVSTSEGTTNSPTTTAITYPNEEFSDCKELCENVFPKTLKPREFFCEDEGKPFNPCVLSSCKKIISRILMEDGQDGEDACPKMCSSMATAMRGRNMDRRKLSKEKIQKFCSKIVSTSEGTTNSPTTTAITYPNEEFSNCKELCEYVFPKILKSKEFLCEDKGKPFNPCVLSSCKKSISRVSMDNGQDGKDACPKMCSTMAVAMRGRDMNRRLFSRKKIEEFCSKIVSTSEGTTNSPTTTAITYPNEEFSNCKELCEYVFPKILKSKEFLCDHKEKPFNPCILSSCKKVTCQTFMGDGQDANDACPSMCWSIAVAMRGRDMDRRHFDKDKIREFCSSINSTSGRATNPPTSAVATCPNEKFSNCRDLCEYALTETLSDHPRLCWEQKKSASLCIHYACEIVVRQNLMLEHVCPQMCPSMIAADISWLSNHRH
ncbi:hypothetical protein RB195_017486 [Necator americanus]|uniref:Uncharacterized protein n=1 Tax=Necator americanus TaxID=51031 RepID=A0ABR1C5F9_NECAM